MKPYCLGCIYCRPLSYGYGMHACHYYLDTGIKPPYTDDGCSARKVLDSAGREEYINSRRSTNYAVMPPKKRIEDDYIFDSRGALDGWERRKDE